MLKEIVDNLDAAKRIFGWFVNASPETLATIYSAAIVPGLVLIPLLLFYGSIGPISAYQGVLSIAELRTSISTEKATDLKDDGGLLLIVERGTEDISIDFNEDSLTKLWTSLDSNRLRTNLEHSKLLLSPKGLGLDTSFLGTAAPIVLFAQGSPKGSVTTGPREFPLTSFQLLSVRSAYLGRVMTILLLVASGLLVGLLDLPRLLVG